MTAVFIVLLGAILVIGAIIGLRLPAFLALIGAGLVVVTVTPGPLRLRSALRAQAMQVASVADREIALTPTTVRMAGAGEVYLISPERPNVLTEGVVRRDPVHPATLHLVSEATPRPSPGDWLITKAEWAKAQKTAGQNPGEVVAQGFGATTASIGLLIALASVIGACLLESGGAERVVLAIRAGLGEKHAALAFVPSGFLICIPAFFDTVFYLLMPIGKALRRQTGKDYLLYILAVVAGATMAHSLVPPTPGPSFVADALQVKIATMMLGGAVVGLIAAGAGYGYALWANRRWVIPLPAEDEAAMAEAHAGGERRLPSLAFSLIPILLPIGLIAVESLTDRPECHGWWRDFFALVGNKNMALAAGTVAGLILLASMRGWRWRQLAKPLNHALESAGTILLITPAGGAFGQALRATDISGVLSGWFSGGGLWLLPAAFAVTVLVRLCQGSATVAMITGVGIVAPLALGIPLGYHPVYLALAIGCGSKPIPWMNDSGFWIISRMTGMTEIQTLKTASAMMAVMGFTGFAVTFLGAWLLPFA